MKNKTLSETSLMRDSFLENYFFADVLFSQFCSELKMRTLYNKYAEIFCIKDKKWLDNIWEIIAFDLFSLANNIVDFNRLVRLAKQYPTRMTSEENYVLSHKSNAIQIKKEVFSLTDVPSLETLLRTLERKASGGDADCLALYAFLEHNGMFVTQNISSAEKKLETASSWNHLFAILMGCQYSSSNPFYRKKLCSLFNTPSGQETWMYLKEAFNISENIKVDKIALSLERSFSRNVLNPRKMNTDMMKLIKSTVINESSKCALIKSLKGEEQLSSEIPLSVTKATDFSPDLSVLDRLLSERKRELELIKSNFSMIDIRDTPLYRPLLIIGEDELVLKLYRDAITKCFGNASLTRTRINKNTRCNLSHTKENIFLSAVEKYGEKNVVLFIRHCEFLKSDGAIELSDFLSGTFRKHYKLETTVPVEIDISGVLPILFSTGVPDASLTEYCDTIVAQDLTQNEFCEAMKIELAQKCNIFKLTSLTADPSVFPFLFDYTYLALSSILNKAIALLRCSSNDVHLTVDVLKKIIDTFYFDDTKTGFWRNSEL